MEKVLLSALCSATALVTLQATAQSAPPPPGPGAFSATVYEQSGTYLTTLTNSLRPTTNITTTEHTVPTTFAFASADLLKLLANSFHTNFPVGAKLASDGQSQTKGAGQLDGEFLCVVDKTGTNIILNISSVFSPFTYNQSHTLLDTDHLQVNGFLPITSGSDSDSGLAYVVLQYDDSNLTTTDGTHSFFQLSGFSTFSHSDNFAHNVETFNQSFVFTGVGSGTLRGTNCILKGTVTGSAKGTKPLVE